MENVFYLDLWDTEKFFYPWPPKLSGIYRPFHLSDLESALEPSPVRKVVFIQVNQNYEETGIKLLKTVYSQLPLLQAPSGPCVSVLDSESPQ